MYLGPALLKKSEKIVTVYKKRNNDIPLLLSFFMYLGPALLKKSEKIVTVSKKRNNDIPLLLSFRVWKQNYENILPYLYI